MSMVLENNKNLVDSQLCRCGETTQHYFFICLLYLNERAELLGTLYPNAYIFKVVQKFIIDTKTF